MYKIDFEPVGRRGTFSGKQSLLDCARHLNVDLVSICGGLGSCDRCKVQVVAGTVSQVSLEEEALLTRDELDRGYRLACMTYPLSDVKLHVPAESLSALQRTQVEGLAVDVQPDPPVRGFSITVSPPNLDAPSADERSLWAALAERGVSVTKTDLQVQQILSTTLRDNHWHVNAAVRGDEIVAIAAPVTRWLGLAVDIGTTKIAGYLVDLESGKTLAAKGMMNPQISYGEDVVARIFAAAQSSEIAAHLQSLLVEALNQMASTLCREIDADPALIAEVVVVGNTAIHHLFLKLPVKQLGLSPYVPAVESAVEIKAREIGLVVAPGAYVYLPPILAGFVGADHMAMLLATRLAEKSEITLAIDIGTNTEICLNYRGRLTSVSCASGPAFEGAHIKFGMRAAPGAIEHVRFERGQLEIQTIEGEPPAGICGSGLLDIVAQLRLNGVIDPRGRMGGHPLVRKVEGKPEFVLVERDGRNDIVLTQKDVRELQLAKAAIRLGIQALVESEGLMENDLDHVIIAGAFGTFIDIGSAVTIGMLPNLPRERFEQVGNAAGTGARLALFSMAERQKAEQIAQLDDYLELAQIADFNRRFAEATFISAG